MPSNHLILSSLLLPPSIFPSIRVLSNESALRIRWPKYWSFSISPSSEYSGLISFGVDWFDVFVVQGTLKSFSSTTVQKHQFFSTQPSSWSSSHIHVTTGKTTALTIRTFVRKLMCLFFNTVYWNQLISTKIMNSGTFSSFTFVSFTKNECTFPAQIPPTLYGPVQSSGPCQFTGITLPQASIMTLSFVLFRWHSCYWSYVMVS